MIKEAIALLLVTLCGVYAECYYIDVRNAYNNYEVQGIYYIFDYDVECDGRNIYKHVDRGLYLYHKDGWWVIHDQYCTDAGVTAGLLRASDYSWTPEYILSIWEENYNGVWQMNTLFDCDCYYGSSALSTVAIICISIACFLCLVALITLPIVLCMKKDHGPSRGSTPEPMPDSQMATFIQVVPAPQPTGLNDQPPPYEGPPPETVVLTMNPDGKY